MITVNENRTNVSETIRGLLGACNHCITNRKHWLTLCFLLVTMAAAHSQSRLQRVMIGGMQYDTADALITPQKIEMGIGIALEATTKYRLIPNDVRDSLLRQRSDTLSVLMAADYIQAELIVFCNVGRIGNLVRSEVVVLGGEGFIIKLSGVGYGTTSLERDSTHAMVADPAILSSLQRALCVAFNDSLLYAKADSVLRVRPTALAAVGGIEFKQPSPELGPWSLFKEKVPASYDAAQHIVEAMRGRDDITLIDLDTRDSILAKARIFMIENYNPTSQLELNVLTAFEVTHLITGTLERIRGGAVCTLAYEQITPEKKLKRIRRAESVINVDAKPALKDGVRAALTKLFGWINDSVEPSR